MQVVLQMMITSLLLGYATTFFTWQRVIALPVILSWPSNKKTWYNCRPCTCMSEQDMINSLSWDHKVEAQRFTADPMVVAS